jgi:hypothetical protein
MTGSLGTTPSIHHQLEAPAAAPYFLLLRLRPLLLLASFAGMGNSVASCSSPPSDWIVFCASMNTMRSRTCSSSSRSGRSAMSQHA